MQAQRWRRAHAPEPWQPTKQRRAIKDESVRRVRRTIDRRGQGVVDDDDARVLAADGVQRLLPRLGRDQLHGHAAHPDVAHRHRLGEASEGIRDEGEAGADDGLGGGVAHLRAGAGAGRGAAREGLERAASSNYGQPMRNQDNNHAMRGFPGDRVAQPRALRRHPPCQCSCSP
jgi:hypothetical protein